jgi:hypothetical protein
MSSSSRCRRAFLALLLVAPMAQAALGDGADSVQAEGRRWSAITKRLPLAAGVQVHTLTWPDGSSVRQFAAADGRIYAVAWSTRTKPRLDELLGAHFGAYALAARDAQRQRPGPQHSLRVQQGDLVVEAVAHGNAHVGRAWLRSRLPAGETIDAQR